MTPVVVYCIKGFFIMCFLFFVTVKESVQRLPHARRALCPGVPALRAVGRAPLRRPVHLRPGVRLHSGPGHDVHAGVDLYPLLGPIPDRGRSHRSGRGGRPGAGGVQLSVPVHSVQLYLKCYLITVLTQGIWIVTNQSHSRAGTSELSETA